MSEKSLAVEALTVNEIVGDIASALCKDAALAARDGGAGTLIVYKQLGRRWKAELKIEGFVEVGRE